MAVMILDEADAFLRFAEVDEPDALAAEDQCARWPESLIGFC